MKKLLCLLALAASAAHADEVAQLLKAADAYRTGQDNLQVETQVSVLNRDGSPDKERRYTVFAQAQHKSLVLMRSPAEAGQKVLMLGDDFWLLMPGSQRPLRITPSQKLLGDASTLGARRADLIGVAVSGMNHCEYCGTAHSGLLALRITDDGLGGADPSRGSGLSGLAQRVAVVDGRLDIASPPGGPTSITVELPLRAGHR